MRENKHDAQVTKVINDLCTYIIYSVLDEYKIYIRTSTIKEKLHKHNNEVFKTFYIDKLFNTMTTT